MAEDSTMDSADGSLDECQPGRDRQCWLPCARSCWALPSPFLCLPHATSPSRTVRAGGAGGRVYYVASLSCSASLRLAAAPLLRVEAPSCSAAQADPHNQQGKYNRTTDDHSGRSVCPSMTHHSIVCGFRARSSALTPHRREHGPHTVHTEWRRSCVSAGYDVPYRARHVACILAARTQLSCRAC